MLVFCPVFWYSNETQYINASVENLETVVLWDECVGRSSEVRTNRVQRFIETGNQMGLIVLARIWRFARVGHGVYEVSGSRGLRLVFFELFSLHNVHRKLPALSQT